MNQSKFGTWLDKRDGQEYDTVEMGGFTWLAENLAFDVPGSKTYDCDAKNYCLYGKLYNLNQAIEACPEGWRLPMLEDWLMLIDFAGGRKEAGKHLRSVSNWTDSKPMDCRGLDTYGFRAEPGGYCVNGVCSGLERWGYWWCSYGHLGSSFDFSINRSNDINIRESSIADFVSVRLVKM
jgi:uncharacterized protein (TIGR02145 family)